MSLNSLQNFSKPNKPTSVAVSNDASNSIKRLSNSVNSSNPITIGDNLKQRALAKINSGEAGKLKELAYDEAELVFLLDETGSIINQDADNIAQGRPSVILGTTKAVNYVLDKERQNSKNTLVTIAQFSEDMRTVCDRAHISNVKPFSFEPTGGNTRIYENLYKKIKQTMAMRASEHHANNNVLFAIMTDGHDSYSSSAPQELRDLIKKSGYKYILLAEETLNIAWFANDLGINQSNAVSYSTKGKFGVSANGLAICAAIDGLRKTGDIPKNWAQNVIDNRINDPSKLLGNRK
ncbi:MAG: VWA domain-containing protein [Clostridiales bacterium]|jgi:hypothetical protein|nr:VWA domain-containing protein [Clostridiales bacterium]